MPVASSWQHTLWRLLAWLVLALVAGIALGRPWAGLAIGALLALGWHYLQLARLLRAAARGQWFAAPRGWGIVAELEAQLLRRQRASRGRRRRLLALLGAFREAARALPDATVALSGERRILWFNEAAQRLLGLRYPQDIGARLTHLLRTPRVAAWIESEAADAEPLLDLPCPTDPAVRLSLRLIRYGGDQSLLVARDITKLMHLEQVRRDFVANVSHELRTPLTVVHGYLEMMEPEQNPDWAPMIGEMRRQSQRMTQIVEDLLTLSRLEAEEHLPEEQVQMAALLATLRREALALSQGRHEVQVEDQARCDLLGSPKELHSAFSNLVANAVRHSPGGGRVSVRWRRDAAGLALEVEDTGPGIPAQHLPRITERFYRVSNSRSRESGGTGLGLSIVKHVLNLHGARLEIDSEPGRGSCFACRFDAARALPRDDAPDPTA